MGNIKDALKKAWAWIVEKFKGFIKWITGAKKREMQEEHMRKLRDEQEHRSAQVEFERKARELDREMHRSFDKYVECVHTTCQTLISQSYGILRLIKSYKKKGVNPDSKWTDKMTNQGINQRYDTMINYFNDFKEVRDKLCEFYDADVAVYKMVNAHNLQRLEAEITNLNNFISSDILPVMDNIDAYIPNDANNEYAKSDRGLAKDVTNTYIKVSKLLTEHFSVVYKGDIIITD